MATYLITGVSGALGSRVLPKLAGDAAVERIIGIDRRPLSVSAPKFEFVPSDVEDVDFDALLTGVTHVIHLAVPSDLKSFAEMLSACVRAQVSQVTVASSTTVYGAWPTNSVPLTESAPMRPNAGFDYAVQLAEMERLLVEWKANNPGVRAVVLRMAMILGAGSDKALSAVLGGVFAHRNGESSRPVQFLHIDDAASAVVFANRSELTGTFNVAPRGFVSDEKARAVAGAPPRPPLPTALAYAANDFAWRRRYRHGFDSAQPYLQHPWVASSELLQREGWGAEYSNEEALVAEATPTWWGRLNPQQRRTLVNTAVTIGSGLPAAIVAGEVLRRRARGR